MKKNKNKMIKLFKISLIITTLISLFSGCSSSLAPIGTEPAKIGEPTRINSELKSLPAPNEKIVAAVYKFRDQTGQYKPSETGASWSTAVTQGATSILIKALEESGWFVPIEREGLSNLLNERKIIRSSRATYEGGNENEALLPPLLFAGIILEGGIVSYETNIITGGAGLKYFGAGASGQYRQDRVTIYLRATSTQNGRVLKTVHTTKTILSQMVDIGLFRFVEFKRLLEVESGFSYNEPPQVCVTEAIEKAVQSLVIEGMLDGLWNMKNPDDLNSEVVQNYIEEKEEMEEPKDFDLLSQKSDLGVTASFGGQLYHGDYPNPLWRPTGEISFSHDLTEDLGIALNFGRGQLAGRNYFDATVDYVGFDFNYKPFLENILSPYLVLGSGLLVQDDGYFELQEQWFPFINLGAGIEYKINNNFSLDFLFSQKYSLNDNLDGLEQGKLQDYSLNGQAGLKYYITF